jgi:hypothetical protein
MARQVIQYQSLIDSGGANEHPVIADARAWERATACGPYEPNRWSATVHARDAALPGHTLGHAPDGPAVSRFSGATSKDVCFLMSGTGRSSVQCLGLQ